MAQLYCHLDGDCFADPPSLRIPAWHAVQDAVLQNQSQLAAVPPAVHAVLRIHHHMCAAGHVFYRGWQMLTFQSVDPGIPLWSLHWKHDHYLDLAAPAEGECAVTDEEAAQEAAQPHSGSITTHDLCSL